MKRRRQNPGGSAATTTTTFLLLICLTPPFLLSFSSCHAFLPARPRIIFLNKHIDTAKRYATRLFAENNNKKKRAAGVYARPSAAIERGSGFFVPGLEGPKVRLLFGVLVLVLTALNHYLLSGEAKTNNNLSSETLAIGYSLLLLLQAGIEFSKARSSIGVKRISRSEEPDEALIQQWASYSVSDDNSFRERVQWAAASFIAMTPATSMLLLDSNKNQVVYRLGSSELFPNEQEGVQAAINTIQKSKSGRVSLPMTHPAVRALASSMNDEDESTDTRCVVLQRINGHQCWMMTSNQLLAAFTKSDLKFLGQLGLYVDDMK